MKVPQFDLTRQFQSIRGEIMDAVEGVIAGGQYILGPQVTAFEEEIANYLGVKHAIGLANGTDALLLALKVLGVGPGDEVIVPAFTFFATAEVVSQLGASPVFVDVDPVSFNIDVVQVEKAITARTRAIIPVHLFGQPADLTAICALANQHGLSVVEDACQAIGSTYQGKKIGSLGALACFSFFPTKNLGGVGDGGLITTDSDSYAERLRRLRAHGSTKKYYHSEVGWNSRLDELQAAILRIKLRHLDQWTASRKQAAVRYRELLRECTQVTCPSPKIGADHVYHQYVIRAESRDHLKDYLASKGIGTSIYYPCPLHLQEVYRGLGYPQGSLPNSESSAEHTLALPMFPEITADEQQYVAETIQSFYAEVHK